MKVSELAMFTVFPAFRGWGLRRVSAVSSVLPDYWRGLWHENRISGLRIRCSIVVTSTVFEFRRHNRAIDVASPDQMTSQSSGFSL
jgi:hypothetical protein